MRETTWKIEEVKIRRQNFTKTSGKRLREGGNHFWFTGFTGTGEERSEETRTKDTTRSFGT